MNHSTTRIVTLGLALAFTPAAMSQQATDTPAESPVEAATEQPSAAESAQEAAVSAPLIDPDFDSASTDLDDQLAQAVTELAELMQQIGDEKIPLNAELNDLEAELSLVRAEYRDVTRLLDTRTLDLSNLTKEIQSRDDEVVYLSNLLGDYTRKFENSLHVAEFDRYEQPLDEALLAVENTNLTQVEVFETQASLMSVSIERLHDALAGTRFEGNAVAADGLVKPGHFVMVGPAAIFRSEDGSAVGTAEQRVDSSEPAEVDFHVPEDSAAADLLVAYSRGDFPFDPTLGNAHKIEATEISLLEEIEKGGFVMYPIGAMAAIALLVALYKWATLAAIRKPAQARIDALLKAIGQRDREAAADRVAEIKGPVGRMLAAGVEHLREPRELIEEVMYETVLTTRLNLEKMLSFIGICAASAPLLGLLGTVTGIINTFKLITVFGSGDVKSLSGGISEALITTKFGLVVAIPSLLIHAFLSRKVRGVMGQMETSAVSFVNHVARTQVDESAVKDDRPSRSEPAVVQAPNDNLASLVSTARTVLTATPERDAEHGDITVVV